MGFFPQSPSLTNRSFVNSPDPVIGHSQPLHTLPVFVGKRGVTWIQNVPLPSTDFSDCLFSSVSNIRHLSPIHLPLSA